MAFVFDLLLIVVTTLVFYVLWLCIRRPSNFPPGPIGLPIVGCLPFIGRDSHKYFKMLSTKYRSNVISLKLGMMDIVVLNDWNCIRDALLKQSQLFSGRPNVFLWDVTLKKKDLVTTHGPLWNKSKQFVVQNLFGIGAGNNSMEEIVMDEVTKTIEYVENMQNKIVDVTHLFFTPIFSIISRIMSGSAFEIEDEAMNELSKTVKYNFDCFKNDSPLNFMAYLRHIPKLTNFNEFIESHTKVQNLLKKEVDRHEESYAEGEHRDFIDIYLKEMYKGTNKSLSENPFQKEKLLGLLYNMYNAGVETTDHTLSFGLMYMAIWPEIQCTVQVELDKVIGCGRLPTYADRNLLPYTEATILELLRYTTVLPLSLPHSTITTATVNGYIIPKGTFVLPNVWAVHFDKDLWGDPEIFRPDRFLDADGKVKKPEYLIPFSIGARFCLGEPLARMELFLFFSCLLHRFSFHCITGERPPSIEPIIGLTLRPQSFSLIAKLRN